MKKLLLLLFIAGFFIHSPCAPEKEDNTARDLLLITALSRQASTGSTTPVLSINSTVTSSITSSGSSNQVNYSFTPTSTGSYLFNTYNYTGKDLDIFVYTGTATSGSNVGSAVGVQTNSESLRVSLTGGTLYTVSILPYGTTTVTFSLNVIGSPVSGATGSCLINATSRCFSFSSASNPLFNSAACTSVT